MRKFIIVLAVICYGNVLLAQDIIILKSGEEIKALVQEVGLNDLKYKKFENPNGPVYTLQKTNIFMVRYENGEKDVFNTVTETTNSNASNTIPQTAINTNMLQTVNSFWSGKVVADYTGKILGKSEVRSIMATEPEALAAYNSGVSLQLTANILFGCSIGLSLYDLCFVDYSSTDYWAIWGVSAGCLLMGWIFEVIGKSKVKTSVSLYNNSINRPYATNLKFGFTGSGGVGFTLKF